MRRLATILVAVVLSTASALGQTSYTSNIATTAWNAARWNNTTNAAPYTSTYTANNNVDFTSGTYTFAGMGAATNVGNVTVANGVTVNFASIGGTFASGGNIRTFSIGNGGTFDFNGNDLSTAAGTGFIKEGDGVLGTGAGAFTGGFTLNAGTVIARSTLGMGSGATNVLTLNGGTVASNATRSFDNTRFGDGIVIGGNVQFGELATIVSLASSTANLSFANNISLGAATRTLTLGNNGTQTFSGIISNTGSGGITFGANTGADGRFEITNTANTFTGNISITGGEVRFAANGSMGALANNITIDGGRWASVSGSTYTIGATRNIFVGDTAGTSMSVVTSGTITYNGVIADVTGKTGVLVKQGGGTLSLGGVSNYTGSTSINNGTLLLTTGNDRLPTGTVLNLGQAASTNLGTLNLNGFNQTLAGLNSVTGTNTSTSNNTLTSATAAILTLGGAGTYSYGDGTNANSGVITGLLSVVKSGTGTQSFGDANTYSGGTTVSGGTLVAANTTGSATGTAGITVSGTGVLSGGTGTGSVGRVTGATNVQTGGTLRADSGTGTNTFTVGNVTIQNGGKLFTNIAGTGSDSTLAFGANTLDLNTGSILQLDDVAGFSVTSAGTYRVATFTNGDSIQLNAVGSQAEGFLFGAYEQGVGATGAVTIDVSSLPTLAAGDKLELRRSGNDLVLSFSPVPEPTTILGVAVGLVAVGGFIRKRLAKKAAVAA